VLPGDYERFRQQVDEQLLADLRMVYEAYLAKVRAYETLALTSGTLPAGMRPPLALPALAGEPERLLPAPAEAPPAPAVRPTPPAPKPQAPVAARRPAPRPRRKRYGAFELHDVVLAALDRLDDEFDRDDLLRVLPAGTPRTTLHRVLQDLVEEDQALEIAERGQGGTLSIYRKRRPGSGTAG
jgi:hypothetical protein